MNFHGGGCVTSCFPGAIHAHYGESLSLFLLPTSALCSALFRGALTGRAGEVTHSFSKHFVFAFGTPIA